MCCELSKASILITSSFNDFPLYDDGGNGERALSVTLYYY
jgi:hypothetical protein